MTTLTFELEVETRPVLVQEMNEKFAVGKDGCFSSDEGRQNAARKHPQRAWHSYAQRPGGSSGGRLRGPLHSSSWHSHYAQSRDWPIQKGERGGCTGANVRMRERDSHMNALNESSSNQTPARAASLRGATTSARCRDATHAHDT